MREESPVRLYFHLTNDREIIKDEHGIEVKDLPTLAERR